MVSTRGHPKDFPEPDLTPTRATPSRARNSSSIKGPGKWAHIPSNIILLWLFISIPLVAWDTGYVLLRPLSMPGGKLHWPLWVPYDLYGRVDHIYGWQAWNGRNGFTGAQSFMNVVESGIYIWYLSILYISGRQINPSGRGAAKSSAGFLTPQRYVDGQQGALAALVLYSGALMTLSKTLLYCKFKPICSIRI